MILVVFEVIKNTRSPYLISSKTVGCRLVFSVLNELNSSAYQHAKLDAQPNFLDSDKARTASVSNCQKKESSYELTVEKIKVKVDANQEDFDHNI